MNKEKLKGHINLLLLASLEGVPGHGYAIIQELRRRSGGTFDLAEGTIYPALRRLEVAGSLASNWARVGGRRRRVYTLTPAGECELASARDEWLAFSGAMSSVVEQT